MRGYVKWAVGLALSGEGDDSAAREHLERVDPLLRHLARRRQQREIEGCLQEIPNAELGRPMLQAVAKRLAAEPLDVSRRAPYWWATTLLSILVAASIAFIVFRIATAPEPFSPDDVAAVAESKDAYEKGGRPISLGEAGEELFGQQVGDFVIALDRQARKPSPEREAGLATAEKALLDESHKSLLGEEVYTALLNLAEACRATLVDGESVQGDVAELNAALAAAGLAYYIDEDSLNHEGGTTPLLYTHFVERVRVFEVPGAKAERALWLRRLDTVNYRTDMVGSTHRGESAAVIRRGLVDSVVHEDLLPALGKDASYDLWRASAKRQPPADEEVMEAKLGAQIRADFVAVGVGGGDADRLASVLSERDELFAELRSRAKAAGYRVALPSGYRFDMAPYRKLGESVGKRILRDLENLDDTLSSPEMARVYKTVRSSYVHSVEFHEIQHRLDYAREEVVPAVLARHMGKRREDGTLGAFDRRLVTEYSAYLAEVANSDVPFVSMAQPLSHAFNRRAGSRLYALAAIAVVESLCTAAGLEHADLIGYGRIERDALAKTFIKVLDLSTPELRKAARVAWKDAFGAEFVRPSVR